MTTTGRPGPAADVRPMHRDDLDPVLALNEANVPAVGPLGRSGLERLVHLAETAVVVETAGGLGGFAIALPPGVDYASPNYRWFSDHYHDFVYLDRVAVAAPHQRRGMGRALYDAVESATDAGRICCEVNIRPRNEPSLLFHAERGFEPVGEQDTDGGAKRVVLLVRPL